MTEQSFDQWCIVELFGHVRLAGKVTEASIGGCSLIRLDIPDAQGNTTMTRFFGNGAIYSLTPVSKEIALAVAAHSEPQPISVYELKRLMPPDTVPTTLGADDDDWNVAEE